MKRLTMVFAILAATAFAVAPIALARHSSNKISHARKLARWEHRYHFTLTKANALADADSDSVSNVSEFVDNTNPKNADTNHNGVPDGSEDHNHNGVKDNHDAAATVSSFTAATATAPAVLVIKLTDGTIETGQVTADTEIKCETAPVVSTTPTTPPTPATVRDHGGDDGGGPIQVSTTPVSPSGSTGSHQGHGDDNGQGDDDNEGDDNNAGNQASMCTTADLTVGAVVHSAELKITSAGAVFKEIELIK